MDKRSKIILGVFCAVIIAIIVTEIVRPKPINWRPSYTASSKIPFGCYVLYNELNTLFQNHKMKTPFHLTLPTKILKTSTLNIQEA